MPPSPPPPLEIVPRDHSSSTITTPSPVDLSDPLQWPKLSSIDPDFRRIDDETPTRAPEVMDAAVWARTRTIMRAITPSLPYQTQVDRTGVHEARIDIPSRDGTSLPAILYRPASPTSPGPLVVLYHGGGWITGHAEDEAPIAYALAQRHGAVVVSVEYRLAPEHPFPKAIEDSWDALKWAAANAATWGADPSTNFVVGGSSAGGNLSAVLSLLARDHKLSPPLTGVSLQYPLVVHPQAVPEEFKKDYHSYEQNADVEGILNKTVMDFLIQTYAVHDPKSELFSPLLWPSGHADLPPTYIQVCGRDPSRDDGLIWERALRARGVPTKIDAYPGCPHAFDVLWPHMAQAGKFNEDRENGYAWLLKG